MIFDMKCIGERLKQLRTNAGLSQKNVSDYLQVDQSLVAKYESGTRTISSDMLDALSTLFCCPLQTLLSEKEITESIGFAFRTNNLTQEDFLALSAIHRIVLNQREMDELLEQLT
ncbi:MAG TPA: XRE family transcriptional regulator [Sphaerochaeta sp.]|jgi:transcriptional regulator with XRE-family HTH domain|nr:XRE family transcriptional regulator [Sphaerochaeta sp.]